MASERQSLSLFLLVGLIGALIGAVAGKILVELVPVLSPLLTIGTGPIGLDLQVLVFRLNFNLASILGMIGALLAFRRF